MYALDTTFCKVWHLKPNLFLIGKNQHNSAYKTALYLLKPGLWLHSKSFYFKMQKCLAVNEFYGKLNSPKIGKYTFCFPQELLKSFPCLHFVEALFLNWCCPVLCEDKINNKWGGPVGKFTWIIHDFHVTTGQPC